MKARAFLYAVISLFCHLDEGEILYAITADRAGGNVRCVRFLPSVER